MMFGGGGGAVPMPMPVPAAGGFGGPMPMPMGGGGMGAVPDLLSTTPGVTGEGRRQAVAATRRKTASGQEGRGEMCQRMRYIMFEIDEHNGRFLADRPADQPFQFLDVCCCPGGFSTYSLEAGKAPRKGIGLSLPPQYGGHLPAIPERTDNYFLHFQDVTTIAAQVRVGDMGVGTPGCPQPALRLDAAVHDPPAGACQLVILDGSFLGGKDWIHKETSLTDAENPAFNVYSTNAAAHKALLVAQLIVMANNLSAGGLLVLRLNMFPDMFTVGVLGLLRQVFHGDVACYKPRSCHVHVGSYYLVCTNFDPLRAYNMQWVPRWYECLSRMRARGPAPRFVPFPGFHLDNALSIQLWTRAMYTYHVHLWRFLKLVEVAMEEKALLDKRVAHRPRTGRFTNTCGRIFANVRCTAGERCNSAHSFAELHPFVQKAFREPRGFLHLPNSLALMSAPVVAYDPLPETLLELRQQAHMQNVLRAQAVADSQRARLQAAAAASASAGPHAPGAAGAGGAAAYGAAGAGGSGGGGGNMLGMAVGGGYNEAVQLGMAGEWVAGLMRDTRDEAGEAAGGEDALAFFMRAADDPNVVLEGGFDDPEPALGAVPHPGGFGRAAAGTGAGTGAGGAGVAAGREGGAGGAGDAGRSGVTEGGGGKEGAGGSGSAAAAAAAEEPDDWELELAGLTGGADAAAAIAAAAGAKGDAGKSPARSRAAGSSAGAGGATALRPELLQMSGYQPRLGLLAIEVEDDETLTSMCEYLGW
ncbi:hypothetical protein HYH02_011618 [Chlamydomonas schloesseri]|uniref:Cap-specific mRNA (nucleoside-2'-O-)-methyltransferase 1 n=1 Tax=Chlamydomonas schloesseri TaxID=2026947 RepID=A0A835W3N9_9CHLO|nr:hypothetical protein HYH02_011618 [Chlamydomonas schloesseri]|eukprot:KAG2436108.1 hypothetical protein HYH02_011618 [Chlamydomonas schloesseri]